MAENPEKGRDPNEDEPVIRDNRKVDPETGQVRKPSSGGSGGSGSGAEPGAAASEPEIIEAEGPDVETSLSDSDLGFLSGQIPAEELAAERDTELKRVQAEFFNYRRAREASHAVERERTAGEVVKVLLPILDDLDRAEKHGDLVEGSPFTTIAAKLRGAVGKLGLVPFGEAGDVFDPNIHEALFQQPSTDVDTETIAEVVETGYHIGSSLLRAAKVVVAVPSG